MDTLQNIDAKEKLKHKLLASSIVLVTSLPFVNTIMFEIFFGTSFLVSVIPYKDVGFICCQWWGHSDPWKCQKLLTQWLSM